MVRRLLMLSTLAVSGLAAATTVTLDGGSTASAAPSASPYKGAGIVLGVIDGDTLDVRLASGTRERVRVLGIDAPELRPRECYGAQAMAATRRLAQDKHVRLVGDRTQATRDRHRRLLTYVGLPGGADLGRELVAGGFATVYVFNRRPFLRVARYRAAQDAARSQELGLWSCANALSSGTPDQSAPSTAPPPTATTATVATTMTGTTTTATPPLAQSCHLSFPDFCPPPVAP